MDNNKELRQALATHLDLLKRNREAVPLEVLKTKYKKPYDKLKQDISAAASEYVKAVTLEGIKIRMDFMEEAAQVINGAIQQSGLLKQVSKAAFKRQDMEEIDALALELKNRIQEALKPFYKRHLRLYLSPECFEDPPKEPEIYNEATGCVLRGGEWVPLDARNGILLPYPEEQKNTAA